MEHWIISFITNWGYVAIFLCVFLQELGFPNPISNELLLIYSGFLVYAKLLILSWVLLTVVSADIIGTTLLFFFCYYKGHKILSWILSRKWAKKWSVGLQSNINYMTGVVQKNRWGILIGRFIPFLRGYASVAAGLAHISPFTFLFQVACSAIIWTGGYVLLGRYVIGKHWMKAGSIIKSVEKGFEYTIIIAVIILLGQWYMRKLLNRNKKALIK
jgi:membrane protein DedA with SNARE-associated domain